MATAIELRTEQKKRLYQLLLIKKSNSELQLKEIDGMIRATVAEMLQEDVAWVEKSLEDDKKK